MSVEMQDFDMHDIYRKQPHIPIVMSKCHVIQIRTLTGKKICACIYDNDKLSDLYQKCYTAVFNTVDLLKIDRFHVIRDPIPDEKYQVIHDVVVVDKHDNMLSIPCDPNTMFGDFKKRNEKYFIPSSKIPVLRMYKIYVIDNESMEKYAASREAKQVTVVDKMRRYLTCVL